MGSKETDKKSEKQQGAPDKESASDKASSRSGQSFADLVLEDLKAINPDLSEERVRKMIEDSGF